MNEELNDNKLDVFSYKGKIKLVFRDGILEETKDIEEFWSKASLKKIMQEWGEKYNSNNGFYFLINFD